MTELPTISFKTGHTTILIALFRIIDLDFPNDEAKRIYELNGTKNIQKWHEQSNVNTQYILNMDSF